MSETLLFRVCRPPVIANVRKTGHNAKGGCDGSVAKVLPAG